MTDVPNQAIDLPDIECSSACSAIATKTGYYVDSDTVIVDSK